MISPLNKNLTSKGENFLFRQIVFAFCTGVWYNNLTNL